LTRKEPKLNAKLKQELKMSKKTKAHIRYRLKPTPDWKKGQIVPGVTTIVGVLNKPALIPWANKLGLKGIDVKRYVDDKADIGTLAHAMIIGELTKQPIDTSEYSQQQIDAAQNAVLSFYEWEKEHKLEILHAEQPVISERYGYGGQFDLLGNVSINGVTRFELLDLKTGSGIYEEAYYQLGGYLLCLEDGHHNELPEMEFHLKPDQVRILNIPRSEDENFQEVILSGRMIELAKEMFLDCLSIYNRKKQIAKLMKR